MKIVERVQAANHRNRRVRQLADTAARLIPANATVLDIGCGDGIIARLIEGLRPDVQITGCDVMAWRNAPPTMVFYNGAKIPFEDKFFDCTLLIDVLHHSSDPALLLAEAARVSRRAVVIKDHLADRFLAVPILRFMDRVGNEREGVNLPYNYWSRKQWLAEFAKQGLVIQEWSTKIALYPWWASWLFGWGLHFIACLDVASSKTQKPLGVNPTAL